MAAALLALGGDSSAVGNGADFYTLWKNRGDILLELDNLLDDADRTKEEEHWSATRIERLFRGERVRKSVRRWLNACTHISRVFRGHIARERSHAAAFDKAKFEEIAVFQYHAIHAQRAFRGYYSRRYKHDYNARKAYILSVVQKGEELRKRLHEHLRAQQDGENAGREANAQAEFTEVTANLHHLVSTRNIPGVYNSPYQQDALPSALGKPIEEHLRASTKELLKRKSYTKRGLTTDLNGTLGVQVKPEKDKRSLQASSLYDAPLEHSRMQDKLGRLAFVGQADFRAGHKQHDPHYQRGLNKGAVYRDPWKNPFLTRGIPKLGEKLQDTGVSRTSLGKAPQVHFHTAVGGNKSAVHPNERFDVIADAERTGGVTGRHRALAHNTVTSTGELVDEEELRVMSAEYQEMVNEENMILMDKRHMGSSRA